MKIEGRVHRSFATAVILAIAAGSAVPADAAEKRNKVTAGGHASKNSFVDSVDLSYVAGHGSPSSIGAQKRVRPRALRSRR